MKVVIFDTETTWLPNKAEPDLNNQPYIIQFAGIEIEMKDDWEYEEIKRLNIMIKPPINIPYWVSEIHWIYDVDLRNSKSFISHSEEISKFLNEADVVVWHNIEFDNLMLRIEFDRLKLQWLLVDYYPKQTICTMNESTNWCKLSKKNSSSKWFKRPKLQELVRKTIWEFFAWAHNAIVDVEWTTKALSVLVKEWVINFKENNKLSIF